MTDKQQTDGQTQAPQVSSEQTDTATNNNSSSGKKSTGRKTVSFAYKAIAAALQNAPKSFIASLEADLYETYEDDEAILEVSIVDLRELMRQLAYAMATDIVFNEQDVEAVVGKGAKFSQVYNEAWTRRFLALQISQDELTRGANRAIVQDSIIEALGGDWSNLQVAFRKGVNNS